MVVLFGLQFSDSVSISRALLAIPGLGRAYVAHLCNFFGLSQGIPLSEISRDTLKSLIRKTTNERPVLLTLRRETISAVKLKTQLRLYQGVRHSEGLPVRGQNTKANARTSRRLKNATKVVQKA
jgi:small subunit ribosomal protein S13